MLTAAVSSLGSQPVPGWANKSNIKNSNSQSEDIDLGINNSGTENSSNNNFNNSITDPASAAEGQNKNQEKNSKNSSDELSKEEKREIRKLKQRDRKVRAHEMAHQSAGGQYAGSASYSYTTGPDNRRYAVGGSVDIETSAAKTPEETIKKADQIKRAATAPAQPSAADLQIAAKATRMKMEAQSELNQKEIGNKDNKNEEKSTQINEEKNEIYENKYLINKRNNSYKNSMTETNLKKGIAA